MDDRAWEKLRRQVRREKIWNRLSWTSAGLNAPLACWEALRGQWGHTLVNASFAVLCVVAASLYVPLVTVEEVQGEDL